MMGTTEVHRLGELSHWDCWLLMKRIAFHGRSEGNYKKLHDIGEKIATKCKGLPLAAKVLGSLLRSKDTKEEWESIFDSEIWQLEDVKIKLFPHLSLSYNELSPAMKRCFSYCAIFPKDSEIDVEKLVRMWMGLGYLSSTESTSDLELRGKEYFNNLKMRSFFQDFVEYDGRVYCKMHDIVHDFARFLMKTKSQDPDRTIDARIDESFQAYDPSLVSQVKVYRSLVRPKELPNELFDYVTCLRLLSLGNSWWQDIPKGMENLIHLRYLDVSGHRLAAQVLQSICKLYYLQTLYLSYCALEEIPREIGYLIHLRHLDLSWNFGIKELPESMCNMHDLRTLNLAHCESLSKLPEGIDRLVNLRHLSVDSTENLCQIPRGLEKLTGLQTLRLFHAGKGWSKLGYLKKLDQLSGSLELRIKLHGREDVDEALKAELKSKEHIESLTIWFFDEMGRTGEEVLVRNAIIEALQPPPNLQYLRILEYQGSRVPSLTSLNHLRVLHIQQCNYISSLGCLGKLPELEELLVWGMGELKFLGSWEFLGLAGDIDMDGSKASSGVVVRFPKLKKLDFSFCPRWEVWEDITQEEDSSGTVSVMPYLRELRINNCGLMELPHQLLLKASSLEHLTIEDSVHLWERYEEHKGPGRRLLSHIPHVRVSFVRQTPY
ncbi:UNVERIFIED_CONTAM: putative disease resistance protein RGA3 [Sesamum radiatum]|uniref:Disease resistance protein RGA3 n=1 Tax=Sesamum radiatum TaxID=300843 RepID=A0AAW2PEC7_SESRA